MVKPPTEEQLKQWRLADERRLLRSKVYAGVREVADREVLEIISSGVDLKDAAEIRGVSYASIHRIYKRIIVKMKEKYNLPEEVISSIIRPRAHQQPASRGQGCYSNLAVNLSCAEAIFLWNETRLDVISAQGQIIEGDPLLDVRAWVNGGKNKDNFKCPYTLNAHRMAWNLHLLKINKWSGWVSDLCSIWGVSKKHSKSKSEFLDKVIEKCSVDFLDWGDFVIKWVVITKSGRHFIELKFSKKC